MLENCFLRRVVLGFLDYLEQAFQLKTLQLHPYHYQVINTTTGAYSEPYQTYKMMRS